MNRFAKLAGLAAAGLLMMTAAGNAQAPAPAYNWSGLYLGINGGGGWGKADWVYATGPGAGNHADHNTSGGLIGATVGANLQVAPAAPWVFGIEGDIAWSNIDGSTSCPNVTYTCGTKINWLGTGRVRLGAAFSNFLVYGTGGVAFGNVDSTTTGGVFAGGDTATHLGWTAGAGVEAGLFDRLSVKAEWLYFDLATQIHRTDTAPETADVGESGNLFRVGLNWRM